MRHWPPMPLRFAGVVLAAGRSERMGRPKALLTDPDGVPFIRRIAGTLLEAGVPRVYVVARQEGAADLTRALQGLDAGAVTVVVNGDPDRGQLSSLLTGLATAGAVDAMLVTLVDVPFVTVETVRAVIAAHAAGRAPIVRPADGDRHGHPVIFDAALFAELRTAPLDRGAKSVVRAHEAAIVNVPVRDEGAFVDLDTPEDYARAVPR